MICDFLPEYMDKKEVKVLNSLIESLKFLKDEAEREEQFFIAYAIDDAILQAKKVRRSKFAPQPHHNIQ
ncbi:MAG: hypothetical protein JKY17_00370 [Magnetovibrio sp.]|nr:hypothetical protein [Magnetovibrio sp.]